MNKKEMPFASYVVGEELKSRGVTAFEKELPFDETVMLTERLALIKSQLHLEKIEIKDIASVPEEELAAAAGGAGAAAAIAEKVQPAKRGVVFGLEG